MRKIIFYSTLLILTGLLGCSKDDDKVLSTQQETTQSLTPSNKSNQTGEEIFSSIFFLQGNLPNSITLLQDSKSKLDAVMANASPEEKKNFEDYKTKTISAIQTSNPNFFVTFKDAMESGNPLLVRTSLDNASEVFLTTVWDNQVLRPYLLNSLQLSEKINESNIRDINGKLDIQKLNIEIESLLQKSDFYNTSKTLSNFGMSDGSNQTVLCGVAAIGVSITVGAFFNYALAVNVGAAINAWVAVNVDMYLNIKRYGPGVHENNDGIFVRIVAGGCGGGTGTKLCDNPINDNLKPINTGTCGSRNQEVSHEIFIAELTTALSSK